MDGPQPTTRSSHRGPNPPPPRPHDPPLLQGRVKVIICRRLRSAGLQNLQLRSVRTRFWRRSRRGLGPPWARGTDREGLWVMAVLAGTRWRQACSLPLRGTPPHISLRAPPCPSLPPPLPLAAPPWPPLPLCGALRTLPVTLLSLPLLLPAALALPSPLCTPSYHHALPLPAAHLPPTPSATRREGAGRGRQLCSFVVPFVILLSVVIDFVLYIHTPFINLSGAIEAPCHSRSPAVVSVILTYY